MSKILRAVIAASVAGGLAVAQPASAQLQPPGWVPLNNTPGAANTAFPKQNPLGPGGTNYQVNYPYPGQCRVDPLNAGLFPTLESCDVQAATSFTCEAGAGVSQRSAGGWAGCGIPSAFPFQVLAPVVPAPNVKFQWEVLNPPDYTPDVATYPGADYYEIGLHEAWGFQGIATAGLFPDPAKLVGVGPKPAVPNGMQWTGLRCQNPVGCPFPADASQAFKDSYGLGATVVPFGAPLFTPIWGVGQINMAGGPVTGVLTGAGLFAPGTAAPWSANNYVATWPSISIRATAGRPVVVKWVNEFPNTHVLCPHPEAADWPCAIDRTFMGVKAKIDHALAGGTVPPDGVNRFGSPQQPDNSWVTHLHGGEIPPSTDGFAEKWFGNVTTAAAYNGVAQNYVMPPFENPTNLALKRPVGSADTYTYPMTQDEATIWFHDHTLGKTHHNVIAGPAGFFPVKDPAHHGSVPPALRWIGDGNVPLPAGSEFTWLDPVTEMRDGLGIPKYDLFLAIQDRAFNEDGSINFSNGLGQTPLPPPPLGLGVVGQTPVTPGVNPQVHPTWVPEYFGDHALVNGVLWPKKTVETGWYRIRLVNGSDSRCYTSGLNTRRIGQPAPAPGSLVGNNTWFYVIANDQGYLPRPVRTRQFSICPGERIELLVDFGNLPGVTAFTDATVYLTNSGAAPFPNGIPPQNTVAFGPSPWPDLNVIMRFDVRRGTAANGLGAGIRGCATAGAPTFFSWDAALTPAQNLATSCMPTNPTRVVNPTFVDIRNGPKGVVRQVYLNEKVDGVTLLPLGMQLNGVPFEYKVTETPNYGARETWQFINLTVDTHPMHPHLVKHQIVSRQMLDVGAYKNDLCGALTCNPGPSPGNEMQVVPDVNGISTLGTPYLIGAPVPVTAASFEGGWKDVVQVPPNQVTTIVADWKPIWPGAASGTSLNPIGAPTAPGSVCGTAGFPACAVNAVDFVYEAVTAGPYVWHCHINSHEDSEMMRTSLVVP